MKYVIIWTLMILLFSCAEKRPSESEQIAEGAEATIPPGNILSRQASCFLRASGKELQDTMAIRLVLTGDRVEGKMMWMPHQKDARFGFLSGSVQGKFIRADWVYMQEAMKDTVEVAFERRQDQLFQKPSSFDPHTGEEFLLDTTTFRFVYRPVDCNAAFLPDFDFDQFFK